MTNLDNILKSRGITLITKVHLVKAMVFPGVMYGCESWTIKKAEHWRIDTFELQCWRRLLRVTWTARRYNQSILNIHWNDWCWSWNSNSLATWYKELTYYKIPWCWERVKTGEEGDDRGWDVWMASPLDGHEFEEAPGVGDGEWSLACCCPWSHKESDTTGWLNWTEGLNDNKNEFITDIYTCFSYMSTTDFKGNPDNIHG